ncbi:MAG TPA: hypothetical protein V6D33_15400 [Cyanophyceae cyanobacterium]
MANHSAPVIGMDVLPPLDNWGHRRGDCDRTSGSVSGDRKSNRQTHQPLSRKTGDSTS